MKYAALALLLTPASALAASTSGEMGMTIGVLAHARNRVADLGADLAQSPAEFARIGSELASTMASGAGVRAVTYMLILFIIGIGAEWLFWTYAWAPLQLINSLQPASPRQAFMLAMRRFGLIGMGLLLFALATLGASAAFSWPPGVHEALISATFAIVLVRLAGLLVHTIFAPRHPELQLVDFDPARTAWIAGLVMVLALLFAIGRFVPEVLEAGAPHAANAVQFACLTLAAALLLATALLAYRKRGGTARGANGRRLPEVPKSLRVIAVVVVVYCLWVLVGPSSALVVAILAIVAALQVHLHDLVFFFWKDEIAADAVRPDAEKLKSAADSSLVPSLILAAIRLLAVLAGLAACALALGVPLLDMAMSEHPLVRLAIRLLSVAALALLTNVVWIIIKTAIDHRLRLIGPNDPHGAPGPNARLRTLLPLARITAAVVLVSMFTLSALMALGIEITPLLAGAGVLGIALGFGAQALVRDIIAGIFLLVEDVFRVGEYIESGASTKGTVERITLRTVALRHHNGPLHFVPFGSLGVVRNNSRDWVIEKFNLPLLMNVDSERVRKMIKKIGQEMMDDPEIAPLIREPLKGKLYRVDPGLKIFRCSFQTAPGNQFDVRAAAYKRIEAGMKEMGIGFADGRQVLVRE